MEEFESVGILQSEMEEFESIPMLGIGNGRILAKFDAWNRKWRSSNQVPKLGIGNGSVRAKFEAWIREWRISSQIPRHGIGNGRIRDKFESWNRKWSSSQVLMFVIGNGGVLAKFRYLESGMVEFEPSSIFGIGNGGV